MDRWCFLWSHAQALKQTVQFQPMKFLYWGSGESSQFSSQWCKVWISFSFVVNLKTCWTNSLYDSEYIAYFWFTHEMCCCLYCDVQNETTGVILCWLIVDLFENRPCSCHSRHSKRSISCPPPPPPPPPPHPPPPPPPPPHWCLFSTPLIYSQRCRPIREQCDHIYF